MKKMILCAIAMLAIATANAQFVTIDGTNLRNPDGTRLFIKGTNLGNWLNPEGYMFGFHNTNSAHFINEMFCQLVGPDATADFWKEFKDNYVTKDDIMFITSTGCNTIRLPLHYKLFTDEDYMGLTSSQDGYKRIDDVVEWCREAGLYLILDMHDAPGGQTGDNIDDSYGYPWLFESRRSQELLYKIWRGIAERYKDEPVILGYEIMNEPIPHYWENKEELKKRLVEIYKECTVEIRKADRNHIILIGGAEWNNSFEFFTDWTFDDNIMFTCHRYGGEPTAKFIDQIIPEESLPQTLTSYSPCFRKEKGAHGIEERGVYRIHQFEKQEMIVVCKPEDSMAWYEKMWRFSVELFRSMDIPVRQLECCSGDLADLKVKSCDIEAWSPRQQKYFEVCSCSNLGDAQARRLPAPHPEQHRGGPAPHAHRLPGKPSPGRRLRHHLPGAPALHGRHPGAYTKEIN